MTDPDPTQTPPPDAVLPPLIERAMERMVSDATSPAGRNVAWNTVRTHIAALTAQNANLERAATIADGLLKAYSGEIGERRAQNAALAAERDALRVGQIQFACGHWEERYEGKAFASCGVCRAIKRADRETRQRATVHAAGFAEGLEWAQRKLIDEFGSDVDRLIAYSHIAAELARREGGGV
jgi:hypothetical protein